MQTQQSLFRDALLAQQQRETRLAAQLTSSRLERRLNAQDAAVAQMRKVQQTQEQIRNERARDRDEREALQKSEMAQLLARGQSAAAAIAGGFAQKALAQ